VPSLDRRRDLLLTLVLVCIGLTPGWLAPHWLSVPWLLAGLLLGAPAVYASWTHAPWMPTPTDELPRILGHLALGPDQSFCDLGAGDGRMVLRVHAATGARCTGIELSPLQYLIARARIALVGSARTSIRLGDLYAADLSAHDAVYVWGTAYSVGTPRFAEHVRRALRPGARLVSYHHPVRGLEPVLVDRAGQRPIHVYVIPDPVTGGAR
jgi:SAM-dependent methyltransferase